MSVPERARRLAGPALVLLVFLAYAPVFGGGFLWDDDTFLVENPLIHAADGLRRFWFTTEAPDFFPLTSTVLWIEWRLFGVNPVGYHVVGVVLHAVSVVLLWRVLLRLHVKGAWIAAAVFALHPVCVESVAWITQRKNTLAMPLMLAAVLLFIRFEDEGRRRDHVLSCALFVLALLAKIAVAPVAVVLLVLAWWRRSRIEWRDVVRVAPMLLTATVIGAVAWYFQAMVAIGDEVVRDDGFLSRTATAWTAFTFYVGKALVPVELSFVYPSFDTGRWLIAGVISGGVLLLLLVWHRRRFGPAWLRCAACVLVCYALMLAPVLGFIDVYFMKFSLVADHWQYFALPALCAVLGSLWATAPIRARTAGAVVILVALGALTFDRAAVFRSERALWADTLEKNPSAWLAHQRLGRMAMQRGEHDRARDHFADAVRIAPDNPRARFNHGFALEKLGRLPEAHAEYSEAIRLRDGFADAYNHRGIVSLTLGDYRDAEADFREAVRISPRKANAHNNLGAALVQLHRPREALAAFEEALRIAPGFQEARENARRLLSSGVIR